MKNDVSSDIVLRGRWWRWWRTAMHLERKQKQTWWHLVGARALRNVESVPLLICVSSSFFPPQNLILSTRSVRHTCLLRAHLQGLICTLLWQSASVLPVDSKHAECRPNKDNSHLSVLMDTLLFFHQNIGTSLRNIIIIINYICQSALDYLWHVCHCENIQHSSFDNFW